MNRPFFGDNLGWLRDPKEFPDETVDLVYLDPPFNANADYNVLFREQSGEVSQAQRLAELDQFQFQHWALSLIDARPLKEGGAAGRCQRGITLHFWGAG